MGTFIHRVRCLGRIGAVAVAAGCGSIAYALPLPSNGHGTSGGDIGHGVGSTSPVVAYGAHAGSVALPVGGTMRNGAANMGLKGSANDGFTVTDAATEATLATAAPVSKPGTFGLMVAGLVGVGAIVHRRLRRDS